MVFFLSNPRSNNPNGIQILIYTLIVPQIPNEMKVPFQPNNNFKTTHVCFGGGFQTKCLKVLMKSTRCSRLQFMTFLTVMGKSCPQISVLCLWHVNNPWTVPGHCGWSGCGEMSSLCCRRMSEKASITFICTQWMWTHWNWMMGVTPGRPTPMSARPLTKLLRERLPA